MVTKYEYFPGMNTEERILFDILREIEILNSVGGATWGSITGTITDQTDLINYLNGNYIPLSGTTVSNPVTGNIQFSSNNILYYNDGSGTNPISEFKLFNSSPTYGPPWNNIRTYLIGTGTYDTPEYNSFISQSPTMTMIRTDEGDGSIKSAVVQVSTNSSGSPSINLSAIGGLGIGIKTANSTFYGYFKADNLTTVNRTYQLPNVDGTIALISDIGVKSLNGLSVTTQTFAIGTTGTNFNISSSGSTHTFNIPDASATARGLITTGTQTINGIKTFNSVPVFNNGITIPNDSIIRFDGTEAGTAISFINGSSLNFNSISLNTSIAIDTANNQSILMLDSVNNWTSELFFGQLQLANNNTGSSTLLTFDELSIYDGVNNESIAWNYQGLITTNNIQVNVAGRGLVIKGGTNARIGTGTLVSGTVTINNNTITTNTRIFLTAETGTVSAPLRVSARVNGVSFTVSTGNPVDNAVFSWLLVELN